MEVIATLEQARRQHGLPTDQQGSNSAAVRRWSSASSSRIICCPCLLGPLTRFQSTRQLCQFLRERRRNNAVECPSQRGRERQREFERCRGLTGHGRFSERSFPRAVPRLVFSNVVFSNGPAAYAFRFHNSELVFACAERSWLVPGCRLKWRP
jgi:hypothetical protein